MKQIESAIIKALFPYFRRDQNDLRVQLIENADVYNSLNPSDLELMLILTYRVTR
jgi:hypothetical protein